MNSVNIAGRIADDPIKSTSANGLPFTRFKITVDKNSKDTSGGYDTFEIVVFRELAELNYEVGQFVGITGRLTANNYEKEDKQYYNCQIVGTAVSMMGR